jgi:alkanesulfonate monooxygenase SsuD/methylene tetrahydromethanopterin reductase-like flavin-dependent oxidoreductase (luciferase family)
VLKGLGLLVSSPKRADSGNTERVHRLVEQAHIAEDSGFSSLWAPDWPATSSGSGTWSQADDLEAYTLLGSLAVETSSVCLGALGTPPGLRSPAIVAKQVTALDVLSQGRAVLGMATPGPETVAENHSVVVDDDGVGLDEAIQICKGMFSNEVFGFDGKRFELRGAPNRPGPVRRGGPPVVVYLSGLAPVAPGVLATVARLADGCIIGGPPAGSSEVTTRLDAACRELGRDGSDIARLALLPVDAPGPDLTEVVRRMAQYHERGIEGFILSMPRAGDADVVSVAGRALGAASA